LSTLVFAPRVERGVVVGVAAALAVHLWREMQVPVPAYLEDEALHLRPSGVLYFGSAPAVERAINAVLVQHPGVTSVVLHLDAVGRLDLTGALMLRDLVEEAAAAGRTFTIRGAGGHAAPLLSRVLGCPVPTAPGSRRRASRVDMTGDGSAFHGRPPGSAEPTSKALENG